MQGEQQVESKFVAMLSACWQQIIPKEMLQDNIPILIYGGKATEI